MLLSQSQDRSLGWLERLALRIHLGLCDGCRNFRRQLEIIRNVVRRYRER